MMCSMFWAIVLAHTASAFTLNPSQTSLPLRKAALSPLFLSDVPQDPKNDDNDLFLTGKLPPPPEDFIVMTGDLMSLFVYSFSDHFVCHDLASMMPVVNDNDWPVWLDPTSSFTDHVMHVLVMDQTIATYSPLLQPTGLAACLLASAWLLAGWWHRAFLFRNTLDCDTSHTLQVTAQAWMTTCFIMMMTVGISTSLYQQVVLGLHSEVWHLFTKGDVDYIWDSLTVLALWRFIVSSLLGSGGGSSRK